MPIKVVCDICGEPHKVGDNRVGAKMRCRACDTSVKVPKGPYIEDDEELTDDDEDEETPPPDEEGINWLALSRDCAGAVFGLVLMGFYVSFTYQFLTGNEAPYSARWRSNNSRSNNSRSSSLVNPQSRIRVPNFPQPNFPRPNFPEPNRRPPGFPQPNVGRPFENPAVPNGFPNRPAPPDANHGHDGKIVAVEFSANGMLLATAGEDHAIGLWDTRTGRRKATLEGHTADVVALRFIPNGSRLLSLDKGGSLRIWHVFAERERGNLQVGQPVSRVSIAVSPNGSRAAVCTDDRKLHVVDVLGSQLLRSHPMREMFNAYDFVGRSEGEILLLAANGKWIIARADNGAIGQGGALDGQGTVAAAASSQGVLALTVAGIDRIELVEATSGRALEPIPLTTSAQSLGFSPDGRLLGMFDDRQRVRVFEVPSGREVAEENGKQPFVSRGMFRPPNTLVLATTAPLDDGTPVVEGIPLDQPGGGRPAPVAVPGNGGRDIGELKTDPEQAIVVTNVTPLAGPPGTTLTLRGKGFQEANRIVFTARESVRLADGGEAAEFKVVSDSEITVVVPNVVNSQLGGSIIEVHTPDGVGVTFPADATIVDGERTPPAGTFLVIRGAARFPCSLCNVLVESGGTTKATIFCKVYVRAGGEVERFSGQNSIVASDRAQPMRSDDRNEPILVPEVYPSYLPRIFNQR